MIQLPAGITAPTQPKQADLKQSKAKKTYSYKDYQITPLADFDIQAKVLARKDYHFDQGADLSPLDLALGWQKMSDQSIVDQIDFSQSGRWYRWHVDRFPISRREIETQSANIHMIPMDKTIERQLKRIKVGEIIHLTGQLVQARKADGFRWKSSLTRNDTGAKACELMMVHAVQKPNNSNLSKL
jgi:hypothetical protein